MEQESTLLTVNETPSSRPLIVAEPATPASASIVVRRVASTDSMDVLTSLLHRAYRKQVEMGLRPLAGRQTPDVTRERTSSGETFVAELGSQLVGMILLNEREEVAFPTHFLKPEVAHFSLFAVDPDVQGRGIGHKLLAAIEARAFELGEKELALSMAEPDAALQDFYLRQGFRFIEHWQWPYTNYRSVILSKKL